MAVMGIGQTALQGWRHELRIRLGENELPIPLVFLDDPQAPRVLDRAGIFEQFTVVFEESKHRTGLIDEQTQEAGIIRNTLDSV